MHTFYTKIHTRDNPKSIQPRVATGVLRVLLLRATPTNSPLTNRTRSRPQGACHRRPGGGASVGTAAARAAAPGDRQEGTGGPQPQSATPPPIPALPIGQR